MDGRVPKARAQGAHRRKRERRPLPGMMLHQDCSRHAWLEGQPALDLIVTLDDATGAIYSAFLIEEEGTALDLPALKEVSFGAWPADETLYGPRLALFHARPRRARSTASHLTQVGRALEQLGVEHIGAFSPQAERPFGAGVPDASGPAAKETQARRDHDGRGSQTLSSTTSICPPTNAAPIRR